MSSGKMHDDEVETDTSLVRRLLAAQFPRWAELSIERVPSAGTDNALYRLGDDLVARLPRIDWAVDDVEKEQRWLPRLAPRLPLAIPVPLAQGQPGEGYPWRWSVYRWIAGADATQEPFADLAQAARDLAQFIAALRRIDPADGPPANRGLPLATQDAALREALATVDELQRAGEDMGLDTDLVTAAWEAALAAPIWEGPPVWIHGDLAPLNLVVQGGRIAAVIDWGCLGVGDPACDVMIAWKMLTPETRPIFREALGVDDATWARGRGWAISTGIIALPYYRHTNPGLARVARRGLDEALADYTRSL